MANNFVALVFSGKSTINLFTGLGGRGAHVIFARITRFCIRFSG